MIEIDLADITRADRRAARTIRTTSKTLSAVAGAEIDEVFIGSCMTNIGHFRAASKLLEGKRDIPVKLWVAPPTKMDANELTKEGHYGVLRHRRRAHGDARLQPVHGQPGAGARRRDGVLDQHAQLPEPARQEQPTSTSARPSWRRSARSSAASRRVAEYLADMGVINKASTQVYRYMNFDRIDEFKPAAATAAA